MNDRELLINHLDDIVISLSKHFDNAQVYYAYLGSPTGETLLINDLDVCTENVKQFDEEVKLFCKNNDMTIVGKTYHSTGIRYDLCYEFQGIKRLFSGPDLLLFPTWKVKGDIGLSYKDLLQKRVLNSKGYYESDPEDSFIFYLLKQIDKGSLGDEKINYLYQLYLKTSVQSKIRLENFFEHKDVIEILNALRTSNQQYFDENIPSLHSQLKSKQKFNFKRYKWDISRLFHRFWNPPGLFIVFMGPDGCGKTSVIDKVVPNISTAFHGSRHFHLRPKLGSRTKARSASVIDPHNQVPRGIFGASMKLLYLVADYLLGYLLKVYPHLIRAKLVVFDRYYQDVIVDPKRYRHQGPKWLIDILGVMVPKPDLFILLNAPAEVIQSRKQEVSFGESKRQCSEYIKLFEYLPNSIIVDASRNLDLVVGDVTESIMCSLIKRGEQRYHSSGFL